MNSPGQLYLFDFNSPEDGAQVVSCNSFPDYGTKHFGPHGLSVLKDKGMKIQRLKTLVHSYIIGEWNIQEPF